MLYEPCASRRANYMKPGNRLEHKQRRSAFAVKLRKGKRTDASVKQRLMRMQIPNGPETRPALSLKVNSQELVDREPRLGTALDATSQARLFKELLERDETEGVKEAVIREIHRSMLETHSPPTDVYLAANLPKSIAEYCVPTHALAGSALSILCNISVDSPEGEQSAADSGVLPKLLPFFTPPLTSSLQPAALLLGNLVLSSTSIKLLPDIQAIRDLALACIRRNEVRDLSQASGLAHFLGSYLDSDQPSELIRHISEALATLLSVPDPTHQLLCMVLTRLDGWEEGTVYDSLDRSLVLELVRTLGYNWPLELQLALSILQKVLKEESSQEFILSCGTLDRLPKLLVFPNTEVRVSTYDLLQMMVTTAKATIAPVLSHPVLIEAIAGISDPEESINECAVDLVTALSDLRQLQICERLLELDLLTELGKLNLETNSILSQVPFTQRFLETVQNLIATRGTPEDQSLKESLCRSGCYDLILTCSCSDNSHVSLLAQDILCDYFSEEDNAESMPQPSVANFQFS